MICRLCEGSTDFGKSHVIPESFFLRQKIDGETLIIATNENGSFPKKRPIGEYDTQILCKDCERVFGSWDDYGKKLLLDGFNGFQIIQDQNAVVGYVVESFDYKKLKMFFISVLWRAGISTRDVFKKISLSPHENRLRQLIKTANPGGQDNYAVQLFRFSGFAYDMPIFGPEKIKSAYGLRYYRIYLGEYFFDIKVDNRSTPKKYLRGVLSESEPLSIPCINFMESSEFEVLRKIVTAPNNENI